MKADFVVREMVLNTVMQGGIMYVENEQGIEDEKIISYVKVVPKSPIIMITFTNGETIEMNENKCYTFKVNRKLQWKKATSKQIKSSTKNV